MAASLPPANMTSASPRRMAWAASPSAWVPVAQAETIPKLGPRAPYSIATSPAHMLPISDGIVKGETLRGPRSARTRSWFSKVYMPPIPEPMMTPTRSPSSFAMSRPESATACFAATNPKWV